MPTRRGKIAPARGPSLWEAAIALAKSRSTSYTGTSMRDFQTVQLRIGTAGAQIDVAGHFSFSTDAQLPSWGLVALGGGFTSPTL